MMDGIRNHFKGRPGIDELEEDNERQALLTHHASMKAEEAERKAAEKELKKAHGPDWRKILGMQGDNSMQTLRSHMKKEVAAPKIRRL